MNRHLVHAYNTGIRNNTLRVNTMDFEIASLMIQDSNFIGALSIIGFFAGQVPGFMRLLRDSNSGCIIVDMTKKRS